MYVRFVVVAPKSRRPFGLFRSDKWLLDDPALPLWLRVPIEEQFSWFNKHLPHPFGSASPQRRIHVTAISWFKPQARAHIAQACHLAWLIAEAGHPTAMIKSRHIGQIFYEDYAQVVAKPDDRTRLRA